MANEEGESGPKHLNSSELLKKIDKLREKNIGKHVPLPQLVVVGDQSSGKSSLLASLTKIPFPRDLELCTRYATQITSRREDDRSVEISIIPAGDASLEHRAKVQGFKRTLRGTEDFRSEFPAILKEVDECMGIRTDLSSKEGSVFSKDVLRIELCGPEEDYLTVIDVPGIFRDPTPGITTENARTVILAVLPSNVDLATQEILKLAKDYDGNGERTLGVLTKPDLVIEQSAKAALCSLVLGHKRPLTLGYYLVRNQGADQDTSFRGEEGERIFPELEQIVSRVEGTQDPEGDIKAWIEKLYAESRGLDLGTFGNNILCNAFKEQTGKWEAMTRGHVSNVIMVVHRFLSKALGKICGSKQLYHKIWSSILDDLLQSYKNAMSQAMFLLSVERNRRPYTLNNYFNHTLQKLRSARVAQALEDNARNINDTWSNAQMKVVDLDAVKKSASDQGNVEHITGEIHDILWSYYQVARERFAIEHCLLTGPESPLEVFSQEWVINLGSDELGAIAGESQAIKARRANLKQKMEDLKSALQTLKF
ncbi:interferon-induced GTP-binding protein Mx2 [Aspergillus luchuensis]|uniref:Interferon-induced GTP-binding protein Mx2 n=1 Tax=Aspergillus kawachii TaxID=1069201 RepID=A0A146FEJ7_ASPKA|nr:interferon-induced GTP-binding protein Mx2 [Aspergillus luchuensis]